MTKLAKQPLNVAATAEVLNLASSTDFKIGVRAEADSIEILMHGVIGDSWMSMDSGSVSGFLKEHRGKSVNMDINSPGGLAYDGISIYNALVQHDGQVNIDITGLAASAATIIAMAGDRIRIAENGSFHPHRAWGVVAGNQKVMRDMAEFLDKVDNQIAETYAARTGRKVETMLKIMDGDVDGTTFSGQEAVDNGFADEVIPLKKKTKNAVSNSATGQIAVESLKLAEVFATDAKQREADAVKVRMDRIKLDGAA